MLFFKPKKAEKQELEELFCADYKYDDCFSDSSNFDSIVTPKLLGLISLPKFGIEKESIKGMQFYFKELVDGETQNNVAKQNEMLTQDFIYNPFEFHRFTPEDKNNAYRKYLLNIEKFINANKKSMKTKNSESLLVNNVSLHFDYLLSNKEFLSVKQLIKKKNLRRGADSIFDDEINKNHEIRIVMQSYIDKNKSKLDSLTKLAYEFKKYIWYPCNISELESQGVTFSFPEITSKKGILSFDEFKFIPSYGNYDFNKFSFSSNHQMNVFSGVNPYERQLFYTTLVQMYKLAQNGLPIPAKSAIVSPVDKMFYSVNQDIEEKKFKESLTDILSNATKNSLVIFDNTNLGLSHQESYNIFKGIQQTGAKTYFSVDDVDFLERLKKDNSVNAEYIQIPRILNGESTRSYLSMNNILSIVNKY